MALARWLTEFRQAAQGLARAPGFTATAVLTLGIGLGATTAAYTVLKHVVLDDLGYPDADRLVMLRSEVPGAGTDAEWQGSYAQYFQFRDRARTLSTIGLYGNVEINVNTRDGVNRASVALATAEVQRLIGARAVAGRMMADADNDPAAPNVVVLSHGYWQRRFGGVDVVGETLGIDMSLYAQVLDLVDGPHTIVGVLAPDVSLPPSVSGAAEELPDLWLPLRLDPAAGGGHAWSLLGKLAPGITLAQGQADLDRLTRGLIDGYPDTYSEELFEKYGFRTRAYDLKDFVVGPVARNLWIVQGAVALLMLVALVDVTNLFLVRAEARRHEIEVRTALGAPRAAIFRHYAAQTALVAFAGGLIGLATGHWVLRWVETASPWLPRVEDLVMDVRTFVFAFALAAAVALLLALFIAWRTRYVGIANADRGSRGAPVESQRLRGGMIIGQVALAMILVTTAGLFVETVGNLRNADTGIDALGAVRIETFHGESDMSDWWPVAKQVIEQIGALPGVSAVGAATAVPFTSFTGHGCTRQGFQEAAVHERVDAAGMTYCAAQAVATPGYFKALGIPLVRGREFTMADLDDPVQGAVVVSRAFAERYWPGENPLGKHVAPYGGMANLWYEVVGVAGDVVRSSVREKPHNLIYYPLAPIPGDAGWYFSGIDFVMRSDAAKPVAILSRVRELIREIDPTVAVGEVVTMSSLVERSRSRVSFTLALLVATAASALLLAALGLYGVVAYLVARRTGEIGVRMALGARAGQVRRQIVAGSLKLVAVGLAIGVLASLGPSAVVRGLVYGIAPTSPPVYLSAAALLASAATLASWLAAGRAVRITPMDALRVE